MNQTQLITVVSLNNKLDFGFFFHLILTYSLRTLGKYNSRQWDHSFASFCVFIAIISINIRSCGIRTTPG